MKLNPLTATQRGITSYNDQLEIRILMRTPVSHLETLRAIL